MKIKFTSSKSNCCSTRYYDANGKLIGLSGKNRFGNVGVWEDKNGLCIHEEVLKTCEKCNNIPKRSL